MRPETFFLRISGDAETSEMENELAVRKYSAIGKWVVLWSLALVIWSGCAIVQSSNQEDEPHEQAQWHYEMGNGYFESNDITHAIGELTKALEYDPDHADAHHLLGFIYMGRRDYRRATRHFRETLRIDPTYHAARNNLGSVYLAMERWEDAAGEFQLLLDEPLYRTPELAHNNLGWAYYNMGRHAEALEHLRMAAYLAPEMCLADNNKAQVYEEMGNISYAKRHYRRAIEKCPREYQEPHFHLGRLLQNEGDPLAVDHFERCIELRSQNDLAERCRQYLEVW